MSIVTSEATEMQGIERKKEKDIDDIFRDGKLRSLSFVFFKKCDVAVTNDRKVFEPFHYSTDNCRDHTSLWLSERLKFRTMGSHDCSIFSVCFKAMKNCETQYKDKTQLLRLFGLRNVHAEDVHHVDANRLGKKNP